MKKLNLLILLGVMGLCSQFALAWDVPAFYAGAGGGITRLNTQGDGIFNISEDDAGFNVYGGVMPIGWLGVELGYYNFGQFERKTTAGTVQKDYTSFALSLTPVLPLYKWISMAARVGIARWKIDSSFESGGITTSDNEDKYNIQYGFGPRVTINEHFAIQAGWDRLYADGDDVDMYSIGVRVSTK